MTPPTAKESTAPPSIPTRYIPRSGPPLAPLSLRPVHDKTDYKIVDEIAIEGVPVYVVESVRNPACRFEITKQRILNWVSPRTYEDFEAKQAEKRLEQAFEEEAELQEFRVKTILKRCRRGRGRRRVYIIPPHEKADQDEPEEETASQPSLSTPSRKTIPQADSPESEIEVSLPQPEPEPETTSSGRPLRKTRFSANYQENLTFSDLVEPEEQTATAITPEIDSDPPLKPPDIVVPVPNLAEPYEYDDEPYWTVRSLVKDELRTVNGKRVRFYQVDWAADELSPTWEPEENINEAALAAYTASKKARKSQNNDHDDTIKRKRQRSKGKAIA